MRAALWLVSASLLASPVLAQDADRSVKGGITADGWKGKVDARPASQGKTINDSKFAAEGKALRLSVGPAATYWSDKNMAKGDYVVKATFKEHKMAASHPHSYGMVMAGANMDGDTQSYAYCIAYGNGTFAIKYFNGPKVTTLIDKAPSDALRRADANGESTNEIGWKVQGGKVSCMINGTAVKTFDRAELVGDGKLASTDGAYGIRVSHNLELTVSDLVVSKP